MSERLEEASLFDNTEGANHAPKGLFLSAYENLSIGNNPASNFFNSFMKDDEGDSNGPDDVGYNYKQDLRRQLSVKSVIGLGFGILGVIFGISSSLWIPLIDGANVSVLYGWIIVAFFSICVVLSLSEIISMYPTSGGIYHFSSILSNEKYTLLSSWFTGWFQLIGNWTYTISVVFSGARFILSLFGLRDSNYKENMFFILGTYFIVLGICGIINYRFARYLERINIACVFWTIYTVIAIDFLLILFSKKTNTITDILTKFENRSGWPDPVSFLVSLQGPAFTLSGYGMLFSMTEEVKNPQKNMPKGAISATVISSIVGLIFILPILTILPELTTLLNKNSEVMPIDLIFKFATESYLTSLMLAFLLAGTVFFQAIAALTAASRTTFAFARDNGLPFREYWIEIDSVETDTVPKNALFLSMGVCGIFSLLFLVSLSVYDVFMGVSVITLALANGIPILCLMLNNRQKLRGSTFNLGKSGWVFNSLSVFWVIFLSVILCLPPVLQNFTWKKMNYSSVAIFILLVALTISYSTWGRKSFRGPQPVSQYVELPNIAATSEGMSGR